jgi:hypothetical protein
MFILLNRDGVNPVMPGGLKLLGLSHSLLHPLSILLLLAAVIIYDPDLSSFHLYCIPPH